MLPRDAGLEKRLHQYAELLLRWNQRLNLISHRDEPRLFPRHIDDSLALADYLDAQPSAPKIRSAIDIGSGGGLPAIPLKLAYPDWEMTLVEPDLKKWVFLKEVIRQLGLRSIEVLPHHLASQALPAELCSRFDLVTSRATLPPSKFLPLGERLTSPHGIIVAWGSRQQAAACHRHVDRWPYRLPRGESMSLIILRPSDRPAGSPPRD